MKVKDLIELLKTKDQDFEVTVLVSELSTGWDGGATTKWVPFVEDKHLYIDVYGKEIELGDKND